MAYIYILRCKDDSLYTGITTDIVRRMREHTEGKGVGAKYTRAHPPVEIVALWETDSLQTAARIEYRLKQLTPKKKRQLLTMPGCLGGEAYPLPEGVTCTPIPLPF